MRIRFILGTAACVAAAAAAFTIVPSANAAQAPCNLSSNDNTAWVTCGDGAPGWRLVVECRNPLDRWGQPTTKRGALHRGAGSDSTSCDPGLRANGRLELS